MKINLKVIDPSRKSLRFLEKRVNSTLYRGNQISQHNRYDLAIVKEMLRLLYEVAGNSPIQIRDTDLSKRPYNISGEEKYAKYVQLINTSSIGRGTQDSIRKNLFVDFHRMRFINRYNPRMNELEPHQRGHVKYVSISSLGRQLIETNNIFEENMLFTRGIDNLMQGLLDDILFMILELNSFTEDEYTFFVSFLNLELNGEIYDKNKLIDLIKEYRTLSRYTRAEVRDKIKGHCDPTNFKGPKTLKRDFHNWINETQQVFMLLAQTAFFEKRDKKLVPKIAADGVFESEAKLHRSLAEKHKYFKYHDVTKKVGFELHHIVPLAWAKTKVEFDVLDNHKNLVYIDAYKHALITHNRSRNVILDFEGHDANFVDFYGNIVQCVHNRNILYKILNQEEMREYNQTILKSGKLTS